MTRHEKKKYYQELADKYRKVTKDLGTILDYNMITFINTDLEKLLSKDRLKLYKNSKMTALKNGFLRSYKLIEENKDLSDLNKIRIYKKMVKSYYEKCIYLKNQVDKIYLNEDNNYTYEDKLKEVRKLKHYK